MTGGYAGYVVPELKVFWILFCRDVAAVLPGPGCRPFLSSWVRQTCCVVRPEDRFWQFVTPSLPPRSLGVNIEWVKIPVLRHQRRDYRNCRRAAGAPPKLPVARNVRVYSSR